MYTKDPISTIYYTLERGLVTDAENHRTEYLTLPVHLVGDRLLSNGLNEPTIDGLLAQSSFEFLEPRPSSYQTSPLHHPAFYPRNFDTDQLACFPSVFPATPQWIISHFRLSYLLQIVVLGACRIIGQIVLGLTACIVKLVSPHHGHITYTLSQSSYSSQDPSLTPLRPNPVMCTYNEISDFKSPTVSDKVGRIFPHVSGRRLNVKFWSAGDYLYSVIEVDSHAPVEVMIRYWFPSEISVGFLDLLDGMQNC